MAEKKEGGSAKLPSRGSKVTPKTGRSPLGKPVSGGAKEGKSKSGY